MSYNKIFDCITSAEYDMIINYITDHATENGDAPRVPIKTILTPWAKAKSSSLLDLFGGKLILEKEINYLKSQDELLDDFMDKNGSWNSPINTFIQNYKEWLNDFSKSLACDVERKMYELIWDSTLTSNIWHGSPFEIPMPNDKIFKVQNGTKVLKVLNKIVEAYNIEGFEPFRLEHSRILNQKKITGTLCLSIHPLDYMTMSDNDNNWHSCMSWRNAGCYRHGTVEMMNSKCVVVAYIKSKEDMILRFGERWNNKKWRELYIVDEDLITNIKSYPCHNEGVTKIVLDWIKELTDNQNKEYEFYDSCYEYEEGKFIEVDEDTKLNLYFGTGNMYNDFQDKNSKHWAYIGKVGGGYATREYYYSGDAECMICGDTDIDLDNEGELFCSSCYEPYYCYICGSYHYNLDELYEVDGEYVCQCCYENLETDAITEETILHDSDVVRLYLVKDEYKDSKRFNAPLICISKYTLEDEYTMKKYFKKIHLFDDNRTSLNYNWATYYSHSVFVYESDLVSSDAKDLFDFGWDDSLFDFDKNIPLNVDVVKDYTTAIYRYHRNILDNRYAFIELNLE